MSDNEPSCRKDILLAVYRTRVELLITQGNRLWTRFNYFLAVEVALGALYYVYHVPVAVIIGLGFSCLWYAIAANDHYFIKHDRERVRSFEDEYFVPLAGEPKFKPLYTEKIEIKQRWDCFDIRPLRVTRASVYIPVLCALSWLLVVVLTWFR
jgi:hypothetical protein